MPNDYDPDWDDDERVDHKADEECKKSSLVLIHLPDIPLAHLLLKPLLHHLIVAPDHQEYPQIA